MPDEEAPAKESKEKLPARPAGAISATGSHAVIVAQPPRAVGPALPQVSRRAMVVGGFWAALGGLITAAAVGTVNFMWPRQAQKSGGTFVLDINANDIPEGEKREYVVLQPSKRNPLESIQTKLFLVRLNADQAARNLAPDKAGAYMALSRKCPHLGCTVPYVPSFTFTDPLSGNAVTGWFRCPCHGSTYSDSGRRVFGPAPRSMDQFALTIADDGTMTVNLSKGIIGATEASPGSPGNISHAVKPGEQPA